VFAVNPRDIEVSWDSDEDLSSFNDIFLEDFEDPDEDIYQSLN